MTKRPDPRQSSLFELPPAPPRPGSFNFGAELRSALARAIKDCPKSRAIIAAEMTDLIFGETAGDDGQITVDQLNSWTAPSRLPWRFPLEYLPAFVKVAHAHCLLDVIAERCGCRVLIGEEAALADLAALQAIGDDVQRKQRDLRRRIDPSAAERLLKRTGGRS